MLPVLAMEYPLSGKKISEAYSLGRRRDTKTALFLLRYNQHFPRPQSGPRVATIQLETPYSRIVKRASEDLKFEEGQAQAEFLAKPQPVRVRVRIELTPTYGRLLPSKPDEFRWRPPDFWRDFTIRLLQHGEVPIQSIRGQPEYDRGEGPEFLVGAMVTLEYDPANIRAGPAKIDVVTPDGQDVVAKFSFKSLK